MFGLGVTELLMILLLVATTWAAWRVARKAGFHPTWGLVVLVPVVNLIVLWVFAFMIEWPALRSGPTTGEPGSA